MTDLIEVLVFFNEPATPEIYSLSLHDALPISASGSSARATAGRPARHPGPLVALGLPHHRLHDSRHFCAIRDRKSTRLNSSHSSTSYAVFCLKKKSCRLPSSD